MDRSRKELRRRKRLQRRRILWWAVGGALVLFLVGVFFSSQQALRNYLIVIYLHGYMLQSGRYTIGEVVMLEQEAVGGYPADFFLDNITLWVGLGFAVLGAVMGVALAVVRWWHRALTILGLLVGAFVIAAFWYPLGIGRWVFANYIEAPPGEWNTWWGIIRGTGGITDPAGKILAPQTQTFREIWVGVAVVVGSFLGAAAFYLVGYLIPRRRKLPTVEPQVEVGSGG